MLYLYWILLFVSSVLIAYQDFKTRFISVWLIALFGMVNSLLYLQTHSTYEWLENTLFCSAYFLLCYLVLHLYFFIKTKRFQTILDTKIGWGDVLLFFLIGSCITPVFMIYFFTLSFVMALLFQLIAVRNSKNIALAGILVICNFLYLLLSRSGFS
jgi:hypothetical protein